MTWIIVIRFVTKEKPCALVADHFPPWETMDFVSAEYENYSRGHGLVLIVI